MFSNAENVFSNANDSYHLDFGLDERGITGYNYFQLFPISSWAHILTRQMTQCHLHLKTRFQHLKTCFHCHSVFVVHTNTPGQIYMMLSLSILDIFK
jgi:hypothetical protein